jgi:hypothetical protein
MPRIIQRLAVKVANLISRGLNADGDGLYQRHASSIHAKAREIADCAIASGLDAVLSKDQRAFLYLPYQHAEDAAAQARSVGLVGPASRIQNSPAGLLRTRISSKLTPQQAALVARLVDQRQPVPEGASTFGEHETTICRCLAANLVTDRTTKN